MGDWKCVLEDWMGDSTEGVISLTDAALSNKKAAATTPTSAVQQSRANEYSVEMRPVWGEIEIKVG